MTTRTLKGVIAHFIALVGAFAGLVIYIVSSTTGYLAGRGVDVVIIAATIVAILALASNLAWGSRLAPIARDGLVIGSLVLLSISFALFVLARVPLAADVYFIPVNYPPAEATTLHFSLVGVALYLLALIALIAESFSAKHAALPEGEPAVSHS